ncbi:MAG: hypothetical protein ACK5NT_05905 [Pyrinomonadaceae bacterium]
MIRRYFVCFVLALTLVTSTSLNSFGQNGPLGLAEVLTGLQSRSGGLSIAEKNEFITAQINKRGITFRVTTDIEGELRRAGAGDALIAAAKKKSGTTTTAPSRNPNAVVEFGEAWVNYDVTEDGMRGMRVHTKFTLRNMLNEDLELTMRVMRKDGDPLKTPTAKYQNNAGQLAVFKALRPAYVNAVFNDISVFIPYSEIKIEPGKHRLQVDADIIYPDGEMVKHLTLYDFEFTQPETKTAATPSIKLDKIWIDYNVTRDGKSGMVVHTKTDVNNLMGENIQFAVGIETADGKSVNGKTMRSSTGTLVNYVDAVPKYNATTFNDVSMFIPYDEIQLPKGKHKLRVHVDILKPGSDFNLHVGYYNFEFSR